MEGFLKQSTQVTVTVLMIDSADHVTGKTGLSAGLTIYSSKAGATPAAITPTAAELDATNVKGVYSLILTTTHTNTLGELQLHVTATGADPTDVKWQVSTYLPGEAATLQADQAVNTTKIGGTTQTAGDIYGALTAAQSEPTQAAPAANESPLTKLAYLFKAWRNKTTQTATQYSLYNDDGVTLDHKATFSDDGTTATRAKVGTGP